MIKRILGIFLDSFMILSLYLYYFKCFGTVQNYIIFTGFYLINIFAYLTLLTFLLRDSSWREACSPKYEKSKLFKFYDKITDYLAIFGLLINGAYFYLAVFSVAKIKIWLIKFGYFYIDLINAKKDKSKDYCEYCGAEFSSDKKGE